MAEERTAGGRRGVSTSREGRFPSPSISYLIAVVESRRSWRKVRDQDLWLALSALGVLFLLVSIPIVFAVARGFGNSLAGGEASLSLAFTLVVVFWIAIASFGVMSGVGSEGEVDNQAAILTIRPPKDVAGGLLLAMVLGYAPFVLLPTAAAGAGLAVGLGTPTPLLGLFAAALLLLLTAVTAGYATGLVLKGLFRRSTWLEQLKPAIGAIVVVGYFWLSTTGRLARILADAGDALSGSPLGWLADLAFLTTPAAGTPPLNAVGVIALSAFFLPVGVLAVVRAAEFAWYVDGLRERSDTEETDEPRTRTWGERLDSALAPFCRPATRGVATAVLVRAYRNPLQIVYVVVPFLFVLPAIETTVRTGVVPDWLPWLVLLYGAWAGGAAFPLNVLGNQGATLPMLLTTCARGRQVIHGYVLAAVLALAPLTIAGGVATAYAAGRSTATTLAVGLAAPVAVVAGAVLAAAAGAAFPRFGSIDLTGSTRAVLPSKTAFGLFSFVAALAVTAVGVLADELYALVMSGLLSTHLPYGIAVEVGTLETGARLVALCFLIGLPLAYRFAARRIDSYRLE